MGEREVQIPAGPSTLEGNLGLPDEAQRVVLFAHGSGSGRHSVRNRYVAEALREAGLATLLMDLLLPEEEGVHLQMRHLRFDIRLLAERLVGATAWLAQEPNTQNLRVGYFGASTGAGAALVAAAKRPEKVGAPTLLIVGGEDKPVIGMNEEVMEQLRAEKELRIVPGATHLFEEQGKLEEVAHLAATWFTRYLGSASKAEAG
jgi:dienelactone hydrolase